MSKSGIPIVSQVAETVHTVGSSIGDIFSGKNVFESLGRIGAAPFAAVGDMLNDISFNTLAHQPIAGDFFQGSKDFQDNPYSKAAAFKLGKGGIEAGVAALTAGAFSGAGAGASLIDQGINAGKYGAKLLIGSKTGAAIAGGNFSAVGDLASGFGIENPFGDFGIDLSGAVDAIGGARPSLSNNGMGPSIGVNNTTGAANVSTGMDSIFILMIVAMIILLVVYYV